MIFYFQNFAYILFSLLVAYFCGYYLTTLLLSKRYIKYRFFIMPSVGYLTACAFIFVISGSINLKVPSATRVYLFFTLLINAFTFYLVYKKYSWNLFRKQSLRVLLFIPFVFIVFIPIIVQGINDSYGVVNSDILNILADNKFLEDHSVLEFGNETAKFENFNFNLLVGLLPLSIRFGSNFFSFILADLLTINQETALTLSITLFIASIPLTSYFFCGAIIGLSKKIAFLSSLATLFSSCTILSYITFYIGQNSGLSAIPLLSGIMFLSLRKFENRLILLSSILFVSFFILYFGMLPITVAPIAVFILFKISKTNIGGLLKFSFIHLFLILFLIFLNLDFFKISLEQWFTLISVNLKKNIILEFTDFRFFSILFGLTSFPIQESILYNFFTNKDLFYLILKAATILAVASFLINFLSWGRKNYRKENGIFIILFFIFLSILWINYFFSQNNYALFKIISWFQFFILPFLALPFAYSFPKNKVFLEKQFIFFRLLIFLFILVANLLNSFNYIKISFGNDNTKNMIAAWGLSGLKEIREIREATKTILQKQESIGIVFENYIWNMWISYHLKEVSHGFVGHQSLPSIESKLPDPKTKRMIDAFGNLRQDYYTSDQYDYYLTWNKNMIHKDITEQDDSLPIPKWENKSFRIFKRTDLKNFLVVGKGFNRLEHYPISEKSYFWPDSYKWSDAGGEINIIETDTDKPQFLSFIAIPETTQNTLEIFVGDTLIKSIPLKGVIKPLIGPLLFKSKTNTIYIKIGKPGRVCFSEFKINGLEKKDKENLKSSFSNINEIIKQSIEFEHFDIEGWVNNKTRISFLSPVKAIGQINLGIFIPGNKEYSFPFKFSVLVNGRIFEKELLVAGKNTFSIEMSNELVEGPLHLSFQSNQEFRDKALDRERTVLLESIEFKE